MSTTPEEMARRLEQRANRTPRALARAIQQGANAADAVATSRTPRDTGAAKRGWHWKAITRGFTLRNNRDRARWILGGALIAIGERAVIDTIDRRAIARYLKTKG